MQATKRLSIIIWLLVIASFGIAIYFYPILPDNVVSHWNALGQPNGYMPKGWGLFLLPIVNLLLAIILILIPKIDPLKDNIKKFIKYYYGLIAILILFMMFIQVQTSLWNSGAQIDFNTTLPIALGVLFLYLGVLLEHSKRNWFIGVRTPWTISSDKIWDKTNKLGGELLKICGVISFVTLALGEYSILVTVSLVCLVSIFLVVYSYFEFKKEELK